MNPSIENIKAAEALIKRYREITIKKINKMQRRIQVSTPELANILTGYDLCKAKTLPQLLMAFHARANYIEKILNDNNWKSI